MSESANEAQVQNTSSAGVATTAKILGIISIIFTLIAPAIGLLLGVIAVIMGAVSLKSIKRSSAVTGITTGAVAICIAVLMIIVPVMYAGVQQRAEQYSEGQ